LASEQLPGEVFRMKRVVIVVVAFGILAVAVPAAQTAPTSATGCTVEHLSGAECQGPDASADANYCDINTWVGNASCEVTVSDGVVSNANGTGTAFAALQGDTWHAEVHYVIRLKSTGEVLFSDDASNTVPVAGSTPVPEASVSFGAALSPQGAGTEVICEVTGTHSAAGAAGSALAAASGFGQWNNIFRCLVN
jgi:hypothetical protein